jgi:hypothetical protein
MIQRVPKQGSFVFWQDHPKEGIGEPAILLKKYSDVLEVQQGKHEILITLECMEEFIKAIRQTMKGDK